MFEKKTKNISLQIIRNIDLLKYAFDLLNNMFAQKFTSAYYRMIK